MRSPRRDHRGAAAVEFALVAVLVFTLLFGLLDFGRALFQWNSAAEATRRGARTAAIVALGDTDAILADMQVILPELQASDITVQYSADGSFADGSACSASTCRFVRVQVQMVFRPVWSYLPLDITMPTFSTTYPVEALGDT